MGECRRQAEPARRAAALVRNRRVAFAMALFRYYDGGLAAPSPLHQRCGSAAFVDGRHATGCSSRLSPVRRVGGADRRATSVNRAGAVATPSAPEPSRTTEHAVALGEQASAPSRFRSICGPSGWRAQAGALRPRPVGAQAHRVDLEPRRCSCRSSASATRSRAAGRRRTLLDSSRREPRPSTSPADFMTIRVGRASGRHPQPRGLSSRASSGRASRTSSAHLDRRVRAALHGPVRSPASRLRRGAEPPACSEWLRERAGLIAWGVRSKSC